MEKQNKLTSLDKLTKIELIAILKDLGNNGRIFHCEAQFQFELAWKLQELFSGDNIKVYLEVIKQTIRNEEDTKEKRRYTDIVVQDNSSNQYIAIELKYKTKSFVDNVNQIELRTHGAQDLGRFDFLWDVYRNEQLVKQNVSNCGACIRCFAIILTNDSCYWTRNGDGRLYEDFSLCEKREIPTNTHLKWNNNKGNDALAKSVGKWRANTEITLSGNYQCDWLPYNGDKSFQFLIFEHPNDNKIKE